MLEYVPAWMGALLRNVRAGHAELVIVQDSVGVTNATMTLASPAFENLDRLPVRFTADGEGVSPPLSWSGVPEGTTSLALIVEDPDAPAPNPFVHAIIWNLPPDRRDVGEGGIISDGHGSADGVDVGRNSFLQEGWLPPDPPRGHGSHDYVFQLFALSDAPILPSNPGRSDFIRAIAGRVLGAGMLVGTYSRDDRP